MTTTDTDAWREHLLVTPEAVHAALARARRIAVVGIKPAESGAPAYYVPEYTQRAGYEIVPVPTYYPEVTEILGAPVFRTLQAIPGGVDTVQLFRRPADVPAHVDDILAVQPRLVWMQLGIRHDESAERLARAGIDVVQDHCMLVELRAMGR
jgi:predicted CoA-binding protein